MLGGSWGYMISGKADGVYGVSILATLTLAILNQVADEEMDIVDLESVDLIYYSNPCLIPGEFGLTRKLG